MILVVMPLEMIYYAKMVEPSEKMRSKITTEQRFLCLGHALLENRKDGVYAYCTFNDTEEGEHAKQLVHNGDVRSLSIYANKLKQVGGDVIHGSIKELSLVLAGSNPGAYIDFVMAHGEDEDDGLWANYDENALVIYHSSKK